MIRHIIKIIWNERRSNVLIFLEFIVVFCIFWFCIDYMYYAGSRYLEPEGANIDHTYIIQMRKDIEADVNKEERYDYAMTLKERLKRYPGIEAVSISSAAIPFGWGMRTSNYIINEDSLEYNLLIKMVEAEYFDVFQIGIKQGRAFTEIDLVNENRVALISPNRDGYFHTGKNPAIDMEKVKTIRGDTKDENLYTVVGITEKQKRTTFAPYQCIFFKPMKRGDYYLDRNEITFRINPAVADGFEERFSKEMKDQLAVGPYFLDNISTLNKRKEDSLEYEMGDNLKSVLAITAFLFINIFLGIIGTFWSRTESRKSEIGLRIALGSSKRRVKWQMFTETMILLSVASIIGAYICVNLGQSDMLEAIGIPLADYDIAGFGSGHYILNYGITLLLLTVISGFAVWYPSRLAAKVQPAETLRAE